MNKRIESIKNIYLDFEKYSSEVRKNYPEIQCKSGCSMCCEVNGTPPVTEAEWAYLESFLENQTNEFLSDIAKRFNHEFLKIKNDIVTNASSKPSVRCVLLDEKGSCSVYENRPLICRLFGLTLKNYSFIPDENDIYTCNMEIERWKNTSKPENFKNISDFLNVLKIINFGSQVKVQKPLLFWIGNYLTKKGFEFENFELINNIKIQTL